jgi:hypothetical protein
MKKLIIKNKKEKIIKELLENDPDILLAKKIMLQAKKTTKSPIVLDQSNYYKISLLS